MVYNEFIVWQSSRKKFASEQLTTFESDRQCPLFRVSTFHLYIISHNAEVVPNDDNNTNTKISKPQHAYKHQ